MTAPSAPSAQPRSLQRHALSALGWLMAASLILPVLAAVAWFLSNLRDVPAQPRPSELLLAPSTLPASRNNFFAMAGVLMPLGADAAAAAQQEWIQGQEWAKLPLAQRAAQMAARHAAASDRPRPSQPTTAPWRCADDARDCTATWVAQASALAAQRAAQTWGARCDALVEDPGTTAFEELLPQPLNTASLQAPHLSGALACANWFHTGAALAFAAEDRAQLLSTLAHARAHALALLNGSRSLAAQYVAARLARRFLNTVAYLGARDASLAPELLRLLQGWPAASELTRRWIAVEAEQTHNALAEVLSGCAAAPTDSPAEATSPDALVGGAEAISLWLCRHQIGTHPQRTAQTSDALWLQRLARVQGDWPAALQQVDDAYKPLLGFEWVNTFGAFIVAVTRGAYQPYLARQGDLELAHSAVYLLLAAQQQGVRPTDRAAWLARQTLPAHHAARLAWSSDGQTLTGKLFSTQLEAAKRDAIAFKLTP
jgi:hypothetical protein